MSHAIKLFTITCNGQGINAIFIVLNSYRQNGRLDSIFESLFYTPTDHIRPNRDEHKIVLYTAEEKIHNYCFCIILTDFRLTTFWRSWHALWLEWEVVGSVPATSRLRIIIWFLIWLWYHSLTNILNVFKRRSFVQKWTDLTQVFINTYCRPISAM